MMILIMMLVTTPAAHEYGDDSDDEAMMDVLMEVSHPEAAKYHPATESSQTMIPSPLLGNGHHLNKTNSASNNNDDNNSNNGEGGESDGTWDSTPEPSTPGEVCPVCSAVMPAFAMAAHERFSYT